jgi:hypothetical protein
MPTIAYEKQRTALLVVDPYNDFISEGGKIWPRIKAVAEANSCVPHMLQVLNAAREATLHVFSLCPDDRGVKSVRPSSGVSVEFALRVGNILEMAFNPTIERGDGLA